MTCLVPSTKGRPLQLEFEFNYEEAGLEQHAERLAGHAEAIQTIYVHNKRANVEHLIEAARETAEAKECFKKHKKAERTWKAYCQGPLGMDPSAANKLVQVHKVFGKVDQETLLGLTTTSIIKLAQDKHKALRSKILKQSQKAALSIAEVDAQLDGKDGKTSFDVKTPHDYDELLAYVEKKVTPVCKRIDEELCEELPQVLRDLAEKLEAEDVIGGKATAA